MKTTPSILFLLTTLAAVFCAGCAHLSPGWAVDYGRSAGQFTAATAPAKAAKLLHRRITVEGKVTRVVATKTGRPTVWLDNAVICEEALVGQTKRGDVRRVAGIVQSVDSHHVVLRPSAGTTEDFHPQ